jgi:hypothetical protein
MAKILINDEWYQSIETLALYESEFERILLQKTGALFPGFVAVRFKKTVSSEHASAQADYALVDAEYREWWVVEVEMGYHYLQAHVLPQVTTLARARYGLEEAEYLSRGLPALDKKRLFEMIKGLQPNVLVVVDRPEPMWVQPLELIGARLLVFEIFQSDRNRYAYRVNGFAPSLVDNVLSTCRLDPAIPTLVRLGSPGGLNLEPNKRVRILFQGQMLEWDRLETRDSVWLVPVERNPLESGKEYEIVRLEDGQLRLQEHSRQRT